ncbi:MAG TPA: P-loop NTPase fold protein [Dehalococcoidia bacterium]
MRKPPDDLLTVARPSPDKPLTERADDRFQRWSFAANVARTIAHRDSTDALVVGLYGPWGEGKTTVLNFIEQAVAHETQTDPVVVLRFNPWRFTKEATLLSSFFDMLATGIGAKLRTGKEQLGELLEKYSAELSAISGQAGRIGAATEALSPSLDDLKRRIEVELEGFDRPVVVLIDDIDRLRRADIQLLFRLVTLTADFPRTTYILAFDPDIVADAMSEVYGYADPTAGSRFLEKIVHVPLHLPQVDQAELRSICIEGIEAALRNASIDLAESDRYRLARDLMQFVEPSLQTARTAKCSASGPFGQVALVRK